MRTSRVHLLAVDLSVGAEMVFPIPVGTDVLGGPQNTIIRNAIIGKGETVIFCADFGV